MQNPPCGFNAHMIYPKYRTKHHYNWVKHFLEEHFYTSVFSQVISLFLNVSLLWMFHKNLVKTKAHENNSNPSKMFSPHCDQINLGKPLNAHNQVIKIKTKTVSDFETEI